MIVSINPTTGAEIGRFDLHTPNEIDSALSNAVKAQSQWRAVSVEVRVKLLSAIARAFRAGKADLARMITEEMGKPISEAEGEIEKCAVTCDFYADAAPRFLADETVSSNATHSAIV